MKKFLVLSLCVVLTGSFLVACGEKKTEKDIAVEKVEDTESPSGEQSNKEATTIKIAEVDLKKQTEELFADFSNLAEITTEAEEHQKRLIAGNEVIGDTFENSSTGNYKKGAINSEKNFVVDFTNKDGNSSLKKIATEFAVSTTDKNCASKTVMHFNVNKEKGVILTDNEVKIIKTLIPELKDEDIKKSMDALVKKSLDEPKENGYNHDFKVGDPKALFIETEPANEEADDLVMKLIYWSNCNYI